MGKLINHIFRLAGTVGICLGMCIAAVLIGGLFENSTDYIIMSVVMITVVCIVNQVLYDVLDMKILKNGFGRFVKVIVFAVVTVIVLIFCLLANTDAMNYGELGKFTIFHYMSIVCGGVATFLYCYTIEERDDEGFWLIPLLALGYSFGAGIVLSIIGKFILPNFAGLIGWLAFLASVGLPVYHMLANGIPYTTTSGVLHKSSGRSRSSGGYSSSSSSSSSGYRSSSSSSSSGYRSSSSSSSSSSQVVDTRKSGFGELMIAMSDVAKRNSKTTYVACGCTLFLKLTSSVSGGTITFNVGGECRLSSSVTSEYDVNSVKYDVEREVNDAAQNAVNEAGRKIDSLRERYSSYDRSYSIQTNFTGIRFFK